eukprot:2412464-Heterocapsa_arctica.AAC.1
MFDGWWSCKGCHARGPGLNKRDCSNPMKKQDEEVDDEDRYRHTIRRTDVDVRELKTNFHDEEELRAG